jgi:hypothetical protein
MRVMLRVCVLLAAAAASLSTLSIIAAAQALPKIKQSMPYPRARATILAAGWQASVSKKTILDDLDLRLQDWFISAGFAEIQQCFPTGDALCVAVFHEPRGRKLYVFTTSGSRDEMKFQRLNAPRVVSFCIDKQTVNCD